MEFFNKKEEILEIQLTELGKEQLSKGRLKPAYYAFYDDDILYDTGCAGFSENQNATENRIRLDTPNIKVMPNTTGVETRISQFLLDVSSSLVGAADNSRQFVQAFKQDSYYTQGTVIPEPLGTSALRTNYNGAWNINTLANEISSSKSTLLTAKKPGRSAYFRFEQNEVNSLRIGSASRWNNRIGGSGVTTKAFTLAAWVYPLSRGGGGYGRLFDFSFGDRYLSLTTNNRLSFTINGATDGKRYTANNAIKMNQWQHVVATYSGGTAGTMKIYIDGVENLGAGSITPSNPGAIVGSACHIGNRDTADRSFDGYVTDATIWNTDLSLAQVAELYNSGKWLNVKLHSAVANCKAWWRMGSSNNADLRYTGDYPKIAFIRDQIHNLEASGKGGLRVIPRSIPNDFIGGIVKNIPQLNVVIDYKTYFTDDDDDSSAVIGGNNLLESLGLEPGDAGGDYDMLDGVRLSLQENYLLLDILEDNTDYAKENFDIEVYMVSGSSATPLANPNELHKLKFVSGPAALPADTIPGGVGGTDFFIAPDGPAVSPEGWAPLQISDEDTVENYMYITCDDRIPSSILEKHGVSPRALERSQNLLKLNRDLYTTDNEEPCND